MLCWASFFQMLAPFAIVGSEKVYEVKGRRILGRQNHWGIVQVENPDHCEFHHLRNLLIRCVFLSFYWTTQLLLVIFSPKFPLLYYREYYRDCRNRMQDLIELTSDIHYEAFRRRRLLEANGNLSVDPINIGALNESNV